MKTSVTINPIHAAFAPSTQASFASTPQLEDGTVWKAMLAIWTDPSNQQSVKYWPLTSDRLLNAVDSNLECAILLVAPSTQIIVATEAYFLYRVRFIDQVTDSKGVTTGHINVSHIGDDYFGLTDLMNGTRVGHVVQGGTPNIAAWQRNDALNHMKLVWDARSTLHNIEVLDLESFRGVVARVPLFGFADIQSDVVHLRNEWGPLSLECQYRSPGGNDNKGPLRVPAVADVICTVSSILPWGTYYSFALPDEESEYYLCGVAGPGYPIAIVPILDTELGSNTPVEVSDFSTSLRMSAQGDGSYSMIWSTQVLRSTISMSDLNLAAIVSAYGTWDAPADFLALRGFGGFAIN